jgi:RNA polymerase sigma factor (sigma-70 family)
MTISEDEIVAGCKKGKAKYQKLLYDKYSSRMLGVCARYFQSIEEAQDALQDGFIKIFTKMDEFRFEGSFEGWMRRVMVTTSLNLHRQNLKHYYHTDINDEGFQYHDKSVDYDHLQIEDMMNEIRNMPNGYKLVFNLYEIEGYNHAEIAEMLSISVNTSKSQLLKAKRYLRKRLNVNIVETEDYE